MILSTVAVLFWAPIWCFQHAPSHPMWARPLSQRAALIAAADDYDEVLDPNDVEPTGFGGFGGFGSSSSMVDDWIDEMEAEDAAAGAILPEELKARRNSILLKWADFVRTAGGDRLATPAEPLAGLQHVSIEFGAERVVKNVTWEVCEGQIVGVVGNAARRNPSQPSARPRPTAVPQNRRLATASSQGLRTWAPACAAA